MGKIQKSNRITESVCGHHLMILIASVWILFGWSIRNDFVFDDHEALRKNPDLFLTDSNWKNSFWSIFQNDFWGNHIRNDSSHKSYRPLTVLAYRFIRKFQTFFQSNPSSMTIDPLWFHLFNVLSYSILCCYLYQTLTLFFHSPLLVLDFVPKLSLRISLIFALHPIHCEPVSTCVGLADILSALCFLISIQWFLRNVHTIYFSSQWIPFAFVILVQIILALISMLFKEQGITILGFLIFLQIYLAWKNQVAKSRSIMILIIFGLTIFALLYIRIWIMDFKLPIFSHMDNPASKIPGIFFRYINYTYILFLNVLIVVCPVWLSFDWSMGCVPLIETIEDYRLVFVICFLIIMLTFLFRLLIFHSCKLSDTILVFFLLSIITFLPASNLFFPVGFVIAERNLFLPILGYIVIFVVCHQHIAMNLFPAYQKALNYGLYLMILFLAFKSFHRNLDWNDELGLYQKDALVCPRNAKIFYNIGKMFADKGDKAKAIEHYRKSLSLYENYTNALNNLANILKDDHQLNEARTLLRKACLLDPKFATGWMNLATVEMSLDNLELSERYLLRAIDLRPNHAFTHFNLGNLQIKRNQPEMAEKSFRRAIELDQLLAKAWHNLILLKQNSGQLRPAGDLARQALKLLPNDDGIHFLLANILGQRSDQFADSEHHFKQAIRLNPTNSMYHNNLAVLYHRFQNYSLAIEHYRETLRLNPKHVKARENLENLLSLKKRQNSQIKH